MEGFKSKKKPNHWSKENCAKEALKYTARKKFSIGSRGAYKAACKNGWMDEICMHMSSSAKPPGYWSKERCAEEASKYQLRSEFHLKSSSAYSSCLNNGWLEELCSHMKLGRMPKGYWNLEKCKSEAKQFNTKSSFGKKSPSAYQAALKGGYIDEICSHMVRHTKNWTKKECFSEAQRYNNKTDFKAKSPAAYGYSYRHGCLDEVCSHMVSPHMPKGYWTKEQCLDIAKNYQDRNLFKINEKRAYEVSVANNWLDIICAHMPVLGHMNLRKIYVYEFDDRSCYIGLSCDPERRHQQHLNNKDGVLRQEGVKNLKFIRRIFDERLSASEAKRAEQEKINSYISNGWKIRNKAKAGGLGSSKKYWTKKRCLTEALKYKLFKDFCSKSNSCYVTAAKLGWIDEICSHMERVQVKKNFWKNKNNCETEAKKYNCRSDFRIGARGAYESCRINGWLDDICSHMVATRRPAGYWTKEMCIQEVKKYSSKAEFIKGSSGAYSACRKNRWTDDVILYLKAS